MATTRSIREIFKSKPTIEGAGVHLKRAFGSNDTPTFDPFLLLDDFRSNHPPHYVKGFPWHPHRGIETITYVLMGAVEHGDSMGNTGIIHGGDVQWMTAGSGIIHQEMPQGDSEGRMEGFQLWANLPASQKMMPPRYREVTSHQIPVVYRKNGTQISIICGTVDDVKGPVKDIVIDPEYLDIRVPAGSAYEHPTKQGYTVLAYVISGKGFFCDDKKGANDLDHEKEPFVNNESLILFDDGDRITVSTGDDSLRFLLISGRPIGEPIAWYGPIVMNTQEELEQAFDEYQKGTFIKHNNP